MNIALPSSKLQTSIANALETCRRLYLQQALSATVRELEVSKINAELDACVSPEDLSHLASCGIRGEYVFAVPSVLAENPRLLAYYRLILGFSQKEFYQKSKLGRFDVMESRGRIPERLQEEIVPLCLALAQRASELIRDMGVKKLTLDLLDDLSLLTLGPQLRGGPQHKDRSIGVSGRV